MLASRLYVQQLQALVCVVCKEGEDIPPYNIARVWIQTDVIQYQGDY